MAGSGSSFQSYISLTDRKSLISFDDEEGEVVDDNNKDSNQIDMPKGLGAKDAEKLCGFLNKYKVGARGLKNFKRRWFVYGENTCTLLYYRTPIDIVPLGEIDISNASFSVDLEDLDSREHVFEIRSKNRLYKLEAPDHRTMMYWLLTLQKKRRQFSKRRTAVETGDMQDAKKPEHGLIHRERLGSERSDVPHILDSVELPSDTVGDSTATPGGAGLNDISISNWKTELRNVLSNLKTGTRTSGASFVAHEPAVGQLISTDTTDAPEPSPTASPYSSSQTLNNLSSSASTALAGIKKRFSRPKSIITPADLAGSPETSPNSQPCAKCREMSFTLVGQKEEMEAVEEELQAHRELVKILQRQIDIDHKDKLARETLKLDPDVEKHLEKLHSRDRRIVELEHLLAATQEEKEMMKDRLRALDNQTANLSEQVSIYHESLASKDEMVVNLTNKIFDLEQQIQRQTPGGNVSPRSAIKPMVSLKEMQKLKDLVEGYKVQNQFLNQELIELTNLRADDHNREKSIFMKYKDMEARFYQAQSKYLFCLEQLRKPERGGGANEEVVNQLLEEAIASDVQNRVDIKHGVPQFDRYGFRVVSLKREQDLVAKANALQQKSEEIKIKDADRDVSLAVRWENLLAGIQRLRDIRQSVELKTLIRLGIPTQHKEAVWNMCVNYRVEHLRDRLGAQYYTSLLERLDSLTIVNPAVKQIELDLLRTLPRNRHYEDLQSEGVPKLRRILLAYTQHNPDIGYCQGINRLAAIALLFLSEEDAFWALVCILDCIMPPDYYSPTLMAAQTDQRVLKDIVAEKLPRLHAHVEEHKVDLSLFTFNWFLTIFVDNIPPETFLRIWDAFLFEGSKVLFRFAIAFLKFKEEEILQQEDALGLHRYMRGLGENFTNVDRLAQIAFNDINPFSMRHINAKRQTYSIQVKEELAQLEAIRDEFRSSIRTRSQEPNECFSDDDV